MQTIASYLLEHTASSIKHSEKRFDEVRKAIVEWLKEKKVTEPEKEEGTFISRTGGAEGNYRRVSVENEKGRVTEIWLTEPTFSGQVFITRVSIIQSESNCKVYSTLSVQNTTSIVAPSAINPRCPSIIHTLVSNLSDWKISKELIEASSSNTDFKNTPTELILSQILNSARRLPIIIVSEIEGESIWPKIAEDLAYDLTALAKIYRINEESSWELTEKLGKQNSCYRGAIRLYWPSRGEGKAGAVPPNSVWTASALLSDDIDGSGSHRFRALVRRSIMSAAAQTIQLPKEIRDIFTYSQRKHFEELTADASKKSADLEIARLYIAENDNLRDEVERLQNEVLKLVARAEAAEFALDQRKIGNEIPHIESVPDADIPPSDGETRFYKKTHSRPGYDVLVRVTDCGHTSWQDASKADKAKKGIEKLEGRNDWSKINHCGSCTGGGMWRVRW